MSFSKVNKTTGGLTQIAGNGVISIDSTPTQGSTNAVQSGGTFNAIKAVSDNVEGLSDNVDEVSSQMQTLTNNVDVLIENGAINLLPIKCPNQTENNVTLTNNNDGSITISGTASTNTYFYLLGNSRSHLEIIEGTGKSYTLSGCTSGSGSTYALRMLGSTNLVAWYTVGQIQTTEEMTFTEGAYPYYALRLDVFSGASVNATIKPMLVDSKYKGTYQPYAKTNRELTEKKVDILTKWLPTLISTTIGEGFITDLDTPLTSPTQNGMLGFNRYNSSASNKPSNNSGVVLTWETSENYGCQLVLSDGGLYFRTNQNRTISSWKQVAFTT